MQPQDMLVLFSHLKKTNRQPPKGWSEDQKLCSEIRLVNYGLLSAIEHELKFDRVVTFLTEAISFWWPSQPLKKSKGLALPFPLHALDNKQQHSEMFVWPSPHANHDVEGYQIEPLFDELPMLALQDQDFKQFFSLVEFLRFDSHPIKTSAKMEMVQYLNGLEKIHQQSFPQVGVGTEDLSDGALDQLFRFVCQNGFKALTLSIASQETGYPIGYFIKKWETDQALRLWISAQSHHEFYQYLTPLIGPISSFNKGHLASVLEKYLDFIETHEAYYRILLWGYLENDPTLQEMNRRSQRDYFETIFVLFKKSKPEAKKNAEFFSYLFTTIWKLYASFIWCDSKTLAHRVDLNHVRTQLRRFVIESVFEGF